MSKEVIIIGKPNVGKSSLFNSIIGKQLALVENIPGLTRDLRKKKIDLFDSSITLIDSAGIQKKVSSFNDNITEFTLESASKSDLIMFVVDGSSGLSSADYEINNIIKKFKIKKILIVNKSEGKLDSFVQDDCSKLGIGEPLFVSAVHKMGIYELKSKIYKMLDFHNKSYFFKENNFDHSISIVGRPNSGKSSLINSLKGAKVSLTGETANLTRDPVETEIIWNNINFKVFDTAGISKNTKNLKKVQRISVIETKRKIRLSEIIILILDINNYFERFNLRLIRLIINEARFLIIVINKIDTITKYSESYIKQNVYDSFPEIKKTPIYFISAKKKIGLNKLMQGIIEFLPIWEKRISTNKLNLWLKKIMVKNPPPLYNGNEVKLKFISQIKSKPPKFILFTNYPKSIRESYRKFLLNDLKKTFKFDGIVVNLILSKSRNPYEKL